MTRDKVNAILRQKILNHLQTLKGGQKELASLLKISQPNISYLVSHKKVVSCDKLMLWCDILKINWMSHLNPMCGTTILAVRKNNKVVLAGDGQATMGDMVAKDNICKVRKIYHDKIITGFGGATADAFTLFERFEAKLKMHSGQMERAAVELVRDWRADKVLRRLEAMVLVADKEKTFLIAGTGDVMAEDKNGVMAIGYGAAYAKAAACALIENSDMDARAVAEKSMHIAADICIYTNHNFVMEEINTI